MERCPCCNARLRERTVCSRCKADLSTLINSEHAAHVWLVKAIHDCLAENTERSIAALAVSLNLKKTHMAVVFRDFLIQQQCRDILDLMAEKQLVLAKKRLYTVRRLFPYSTQLQQLNSFSDYLLAQSVDHSHLLHHSVPEAFANILDYPM